jgi:membrane-associated protease RseP (regulator of RpoE activity)
MIRRAVGAKVPVVVLRGGERKTLEIEAMSSPFHRTDPVALCVRNIVPGSPLAKAGVADNDDIVAVDGKPVYFGHQLDEILRNSPARRLMLDVRRRDPGFKDSDFKAGLELGTRTWWTTPTDERLSEARILRTVKTGPAHGLLREDDLVVQIDGKPVRSWVDLKAAVEPAANRTLAVVVERDGKRVDLSIAPAVGESGKGMLGVEKKDTAVFAHVEPDSFFGKAGVQSGDEVYSAADGKTGKITLSKAKVLGVRKADGEPVKFEVVRGKERKVVPITLVPERKEEGDLAAAGFECDPKTGGLRYYPSKPLRRRATGDAIAAGLQEPWDVTILTFDLLGKLITGGESATGLSGPVGIIQASYMFAQLSFGNFLWLLCLITVNLGIFNLLPIPILDGGHNLLLLIEVIRKRFGKPPPSPNFVAAFQWTGLIFVLALFIFVTFNDIGRIVGRG